MYENRSECELAGQIHHRNESTTWASRVICRGMPVSRDTHFKRTTTVLCD